jgi:hypothetical protein
LKEIRILFGIKGFLVLAVQDHQQPLFFQGGSFLDDEYLHGLISEGNPIQKFATWTAGSKKQNKKNNLHPSNTGFK